MAGRIAKGRSRPLELHGPASEFIGVDKSSRRQRTKMGNEESVGWVEMSSEILLDFLNRKGGLKNPLRIHHRLRAQIPKSSEETIVMTMLTQFVTDRNSPLHKPPKVSPVMALDMRQFTTAGSMMRNLKWVTSSIAGASRARHKN